MLIKQGPNKIDWCDFTWNPISGFCQHSCSYCYMWPIWKRFPELRIGKLRSEYLLDCFPKKSSVIFVGSSTDMFGDWVPSEWIQQVLNVAAKETNHKFLFLTKNPKRYGEFIFSENCRLGTTVDGTTRTENNIDDLYCEAQGDLGLFVSYEPLLGPVVLDSLIEWVIIGADSNKGAAKPPLKWADDIIWSAKENDIPVWVKDNYQYPEIIKQRPF